MYDYSFRIPDVDEQPTPEEIEAAYQKYLAREEDAWEQADIEYDEERENERD